MNDERLAEIRARCEAATRGPWEMHALDADLVDVCNDWGESITEYASPQNAVFIAHARTDIPDLLDEIERLRAELDFSARIAAYWGAMLKFDDDELHV